MKPNKIGTLGQFSIVALSIIFLVSFILFVLPRFPSVLENSGEREWFIVSWNLPGPLMFISVFRVHVTRMLQEKLARRKVLGVTRWVKFWFIVSITFGIISLLSLLIYTNPTSLPPPTLLGVIAVASLWVLVIGSSIIMATMSPTGSAKSLDGLRQRERVILGLTSIVFLVFTTLSSIALSFPFK